MDYDAWKTTPCELSHERECRKCEEKDQTLDEASEWLQEIVKQLYTKDALDVNHLENCLDELCHLLKVKMNTGDIQIARPSTKNHPMITDWMAFNQSFLTKLAQGAK